MDSEYQRKLTDVCIFDSKILEMGGWTPEINKKLQNWVAILLYILKLEEILQNIYSSKMIVKMIMNDIETEYALRRFNDFVRDITWSDYPKTLIYLFYRQLYQSKQIKEFDSLMNYYFYSRREPNFLFKTPFVDFTLYLDSSKKEKLIIPKIGEQPTSIKFISNHSKTFRSTIYWKDSKETNGVLIHEKDSEFPKDIVTKIKNDIIIIKLAEILASIHEKPEIRQIYKFLLTENEEHIIKIREAELQLKNYLPFILNFDAKKLTDIIEIDDNEINVSIEDYWSGYGGNNYVALCVRESRYIAAEFLKRLTAAKCSRHLWIETYTRSKLAIRSIM